MGCELVGITEDGRSVRFDFERVTKVSDTTTEVMMYPDVGVAALVRTSTIKPAPSERNDSVEIMQAVSMLPGTVYCSPIMNNPRLLLDREHVIQTIYQASRR